MPAFSAPGKALVVGGYLVLFQEHTAYSVALSSRMHAVSELADGEPQIAVHSPQFESQWTYNISEFPTKAVNETHSNPFVGSVVSVIKAYFGESTRPAKVTVYSDSGFHSQADAKPGTNSRFSNHGRPITDVPKTGLGSSAALCVVVTAALYSLYDPESQVGSESYLNTVHNLAQIAHSVAQGKVGSGFDVATAVYGSIEYSRFSPSFIPDQIDPAEVRKAVDQTWDQTIKLTELPDWISFLLGDVKGGSETPAMVKNVLQWKDSNEQAETLWNNLAVANKNFIAALKIDSPAQRLRDRIASIRAQLRRITESSGVPIEPEEQTKLLDRAGKIDGVINGVVPGAGGYDALCLLVESSKLESVIDQLKQMPDLSQIDWLKLKPESVGLKQEEPAAY